VLPRSEGHQQDFGGLAGDQQAVNSCIETDVLFACPTLLIRLPDAQHRIAGSEQPRVVRVGHRTQGLKIQGWALLSMEDRVIGPFESGNVPR
jgi:hypothetical protein